MAHFAVIIVIAAALLAPATQAGPVCTCDSKTDYQTYEIPITEGLAYFTQVVDVNKDNQIVIFHVPQHNNVAHSDIMYDYKTKFAMTLFVDSGVCVLDNMPNDFMSLDTLVTGFEAIKNPGQSRRGGEVKIETFYRMIPEPVHDRSILGDEMAQMCAKHPVYRLEIITEPAVVPAGNETADETSGNATETVGSDANKEGRAQVSLTCTSLRWICTYTTRSCIHTWDCGSYSVNRPTICNGRHITGNSNWDCRPGCP